MNEREGFELCVQIIGFIIGLAQAVPFPSLQTSMQKLRECKLRSDAIRRHHLGALHTVDLAAAFDKPMDGN